MLVQAGASLSASNKEGLTPLLVAASAGAELAVEMCLRSGAHTSEQHRDVLLSHCDLQGNTALHFAARNGGCGRRRIRAWVAFISLRACV